MRKKYTTIICITMILAFLLTGCSVLNPFASTPEKTVYGFLNSLNKKDVSKALEYIEPSQAKGISAMLKLTGDFLGFDINALLDMMPLFNSVDNPADVTEFKFVIEDIENYDDEAWVTGLEQNSGEEMSFHLVLEESKWYICIDDFQ